ncbi:MAG: TIGR01458 family HAD-type hydrolase [Actinomycetota bacterium]
MARFDGVLLDIDGVLTVSWKPLPGAVDTIGWLREHDIPFRLITNTTTHTRRDLSRTLASVGIAAAPDEIVTSVVATAAYLRSTHPDARTFVLSDGDATADLEGVRIVQDEADVIVIGGAYEGFDYPTMNRVFRMLMDGAHLVAMHRNLHWWTSDGWQLDGGAYVAGLEEATGRPATVCGKPAAAYFAAALDQIGVSAARAAMVGDDVASDVLGAQAAGLTGVLVRTGKFRPEDLERVDGRPDVAIDTIGDLPDALRSA